MSPGEAEIIDGLVAKAVADTLKDIPRSRRPRVHSVDELRTLADVEVQRMSAGCDGDSACLAELAGALGARYVVSGSLGRLGTDVVLQLSLQDTQAATTLARANTTRADLGAVGDAVDDVVGDVLAPIVEPLAPGDRRSSRAVPWGSLVSGGIAVLGVATAAIGLGGLALLDARLASGSGASPAEKQQALDLAWPALAVGVAGAGVAVAGGVGAALLAGRE